MIQGTEEWFEARKGKLTASRAQAIASNGKGLESYVESILAEKYSEKTDNFSNEHTERGHELEPIARDLYEMNRGVTVEEVGFIEIDGYGASPDGLVGEDGGIEIKCLDDKGHFHMLMTEKIDTGYEWQVQMNLLVTGRKWWDVVFFNPNFSRSLLIIRRTPDEKKQEKLKDGIVIGKELITEYSKKYEQR